MIVDFSLDIVAPPETMEVDQHFASAKREKIHQSRILYLVKMSLRNEREIKTFSGEEKWRDYVSSKPVVKEKLNKILETEWKW